MLTVDRKQFSRALDLAGSVIERRNTIPALSGVKLIANGVLAVESTDLDNSIRVELPGGGEGEICLCGPSEVHAAIDQAGGDSVAIEKVGKQAHVSTGALVGKISALPADEHPGFKSLADEQFSCTLTGGDLRQIQRVGAAISTEETRYYLNGVRAVKRGDGRYRFCATDGHRLMWVDLELADANGELPEIIIPRRSANIAFNRLGDAEAVRFVCSKGGRTSRVSFTADLDGLGFSLSSRTIDGQYPDVERVIPKESDKTLAVESDALTRAINTLRPFGTEKFRAVKLAPGEGKLTVALKSPDLGEAEYEIAAEHDCPAKFEIAFNSRYLLDILGALNGERVEFRLNDPAAPTLITDPADTAFGAVLMPMRV